MKERKKFVTLTPSKTLMEDIFSSTFDPRNNFNLKKKRRERINPKLRITSLGLTVRDKKNRGNSWKILSRRRPLAIQIKLIHSFLSDAKGEWQGRGRKLTAFLAPKQRIKRIPLLFPIRNDRA